MNESRLTRQALPSKRYRELLGTALCVFNSNVSFIIENILHTDSTNFNWFKLLDLEAGKLFSPISDTISQNAGNEILNLYQNIVRRRNRIMHSFQITDQDGEQKLATKTRIKEGNEQYVITEDYLEDFIKLNEELAIKLYQYREDFGKAI